jgi:predicted transcriptional regulator
MEIHLNPDQEARLSQIAIYTGKNAEELVVDAALRLLEEDAAFRAAVRKGVEQADRGQFVSEEEMNAHVGRMTGA